MRRREILQLGSLVAVVDEDGSTQVGEVVLASEAMPLEHIRRADNHYHPEGQFYRIWTVQVGDQTVYLSEESLLRDQKLTAPAYAKVEAAIIRGNTSTKELLLIQASAWVAGVRLQTRQQINDQYELDKLAS